MIFMPLIKVNNLEKTYTSGGVKIPALKNISFEIQKGEFVAVMGPSGSGKSTLLQILAFLDGFTGGEYFFEKKNVKEYKKDEIAKIRNIKLGFIFQAFNLLPNATVFENVKLPLIYSDVPEKLWDSTASKAIEEVGLANRRHHESSKLSGGEKQRVAIARALINNPEIIFADEPTGNLDSKSGKTVMEIIQKLNEEGKTIILITHETYTAEHAERIIKIHDGEIVSDEKVLKRNKAAENFVK